MDKSTEEIGKIIEIIDDFKLVYKSEMITQMFHFITHFHEKWEIVYYIKSHNNAFINEINYDILSGDILVIPPRQLHSIRYRINTSYARYVLHLSSEYIMNILGRSEYKTFRDFFIHLEYKKVSLQYPSINKFNQLFYFLNEQVIKEEDYSAPIIKAYTATIALEIFKHFNKLQTTNIPPSNEVITQQIIKYINDHYNTDITLDIFEKELFLSKSYICRLFSQTVGLSIIEYVQHRRTIEAQKLLEYTNKAIVEVCFECGFNNLPHFYRVFKKISLMSPKQYRDSKQVNQ